MYYTSPLQEIVFAAPIVPERMHMFDQDLKTGLSIIWNTGKQASFTIDGVVYKVKKNAIFFLTGLQHIDNYSFESLNVIQFNKAFYCVENHDSEVGCRGLLFFGSSETPLLYVDKKEQEKFNLLWKIILMEIEEEEDPLKVDMLRVLLKRFLILCVRIYRKQNFQQIKDSKSIGIIKEYNYLVEKHYKEYASVSDYARMLFKSPKTLSNIFKKHIDKSPLQIINERRLLEAKRLIRYTDLSVQEISDELLFNDVQAFSHFFKKHTKETPTKFRAL